MTALAHSDITALSPLPSEVVSLLYSHFLAQNSIEDRSHFINLISLYKEIYSENAWRMYEIVELTEQNHRKFFRGYGAGRTSRRKAGERY
ncbi:hypothetical protein IAR50_005787 [Cryptococcus sp. DSM 104548]